MRSSGAPATDSHVGYPLGRSGHVKASVSPETSSEFGPPRDIPQLCKTSVSLENSSRKSETARVSRGASSIFPRGMRL
eukprot:8625029-Pyramimonas_sp.AAC.1